MALRFLHGWGLDTRLWGGVVERLPGQRIELCDRGYFPGVRPPPPPPASGRGAVVVAHSFGTLLALRDPPADCRGLVAVNGFDRFTAGGDFPGVSRRVVERMLARFAEEPATVLGDFRKRCGDEEPFGEPDLGRLHADLEALRDWDCREEAGRLGVPILSLQGAADPILPPAMRDAVFAGADRVERLTHPAAGHLLPVADPAFCAARIRAFAETLR